MLYTLIFYFQNDAEIALGNCQLYVYGAYALNVYTCAEGVIIMYQIFRADFVFQSTATFVTILLAAKLMFRGAVLFVVKLFMKDLARPSCTCSHNRANHTAVAE